MMLSVSNSHLRRHTDYCRDFVLEAGTQVVHTVGLDQDQAWDIGLEEDIQLARRIVDLVGIDLVEVGHHRAAGEDRHIDHTADHHVAAVDTVHIAEGVRYIVEVAAMMVPVAILAGRTDTDCYHRDSTTDLGRDYAGNFLACLQIPDARGGYCNPRSGVEVALEQSVVHFDIHKK